MDVSTDKNFFKFQWGADFAESLSKSHFVNFLATLLSPEVNLNRAKNKLTKTFFHWWKNFIGGKSFVN